MASQPEETAAPLSSPRPRSNPDDWPLWNIDLRMLALDVNLTDYLSGNDPDKGGDGQPVEELKSPFEHGVTGPEGVVPEDIHEREQHYQARYVYHEFRWCLEKVLQQDWGDGVAGVGFGKCGW